jgi:putative phage-type endonuclease
MRNWKSTKDMSRDEWLEERKKGIGGTDVAPILGLSKWKSPLEVYLDKKGISPPKPDNAVMRAGREMEEVIARYYVAETGKIVQNDFKIRYFKDNFILMANMDRMILSDEDQPTGILECKTTSAFYFKTWDGEIPTNYYLQLQHYLGVTGLTWGSFAVMLDDRNFHLMYFERDDDMISKLFIRLDEWWERHIVGDLQPEPVLETDLTYLYPKDKDYFRDGSKDDYKIYKKLKPIMEQQKELKSEADALKLELKKSIKDAQALVFDDITLCTFKAPASKQVFDEDRFKTENLETWNEFQTDKQSNRRLLIK